MRPTLLSIGVFHFHAYTVAIAIAFLVCVLSAVRENYKRERPFPITPAAGLFIFLGAFVGGRAFHIVQYGELSNLYRAVFIWEPGLVYYGGLMGGFLGGVLYMKWHKVPLLPMADIAFPYAALGGAIVRMGCFLNGCCWGVPTEFPWGVPFPKSSLAYALHLEEGLIGADAAFSLPVHPTQLYSAGGSFLIFLIMRYAYKRIGLEAGKTPGHPLAGFVAFLYPLLYGMLRFTVEIFRGDSARSVFGMTVSQTVSMALFLGASTVLAVMWARSRRQADPGA